MLGAPGWLKDVQIPVWWEPLVPGSAMERESSVCIRFEQLWAQQRDAEAMATRQQIRSRLVEILNKIQQVSGVDNAPFVATDVSYIAYVNKEGKLEGLITIQKRTKEALEDDIAIGVMLAFHIGNEVQSETAQGFKWCPVSGEYGRTQCGVTGITAAHTWAGLSRRKVTMGTQKAGRRVWIIRDPKEGTIRRIVALLSGRNGDRTSLLARIRTTPWSRKKQHMIRTGQPRVASEAMGAASTLVGQLGAEENGKESGIAPQKPGKNFGLLGMDWHRMWEQGLGPVTVNEHRSPGSLKEVKTAWLREQGDWNGAKAASEGWVLLEGRACEIARAEARLSLQQACEQGSIPDYLQSLRQRGHVGLANMGLTVLPGDGTLGRESDEHRCQDQVNEWMAWLDWSVRFVRPTWETNVTTWNMGPMGYEYSRTQLQHLLARGQAIVMAQEVRFPSGARQRVKRELKHLHPEYHCFLEAGKDPLTADGNSPNTEGLNNPWCNRGHFAVATFLHRWEIGRAHV